MFNTFTFIMVFMFTWWMVLFTVLPFGSRAPDEPEKGHSHGAPAKAHLKVKLLVTTLITIVITALFFWLTDGVLIAPGGPTA